MTDTFMLIVLWVHLVAAVAWVGGGIFFWVVLRPALRTLGVPAGARGFITSEFGQLVTLCMWALVITGGILAFTRLADPAATATYGWVLAVKVALSAWMFFIAINRTRRAITQANGHGGFRAVLRALGHVNMTVILGLIVLFLSEVLRYIIETG
jgi:uncharacterized membrane protein